MEKIITYGINELTNMELLAILVKDPQFSQEAWMLAHRILDRADHDLRKLSRFSFCELQKWDILKNAQALTLVAAIELGRRLHMTPIRDRPKIRCSQDAYDLFNGHLGDLNHEEFWILTLNRANEAVSRKRISAGGRSGTLVDAKLVFQYALELEACSIILFHNHPSGALQPSNADVQLTEKLYNAGKLLDIAVLDHLIVCARGYYSFADAGMMKNQ